MNPQNLTFEQRYPEHDNPTWFVPTMDQQDNLDRCRREHEKHIHSFLQTLTNNN